MRTGYGSRFVRRGLLLAFLVMMTGITDDPVHRPRCDEVFDRRAWDRVVVECRAPRWQARERLARAWLAVGTHTDEALAAAEQLSGTDVAADAWYLAGYLYSGRDGAANQDLTRQRFQQSLAEYQRTGRHAGAALAASWLSGTARTEMRFDDQLHMAQVAVDEARLSDDAAALGRALGKLAEAYDRIGMEQAARDSFLAAEQHCAHLPDELANILFKYAVFLLDLGRPHELRTSLRYLEAAETQRAAAIAKGIGSIGYLRSLATAIRLNRADALCQLGELDAAERELAAAEHEYGADASDVELGRLRLVRGYLAARRHDPAAAESLFVQVQDGTLDDDYRVRIALELARMYRDAGQLAPAERVYRDAIAIIERVRGTSQDVELRPWVLARRTRPHMELLALFAEQGRSVDALVVAESLHARAWLDVVLEQRQSTAPAAAHALSAARIRQRLRAAPSPPLPAEDLMATIGDREALVFLTMDAVPWRAHIAHGRVDFARLPADVVDAAYRFRLHPDDRAAAERASSALLPADLTDGRSPLYIVASGALADVPFAALRFRDRFLIEHRPVARLPGLAALRCTPATWTPDAVILGDARGDLAEAAREAQQVAAAHGVTAQLGRAASRAALMPARRAQLLHIAAHGVTTPSGRAIALADGALTAADVLETALAPEVVVLAGCTTAASDDAESWNGFPSAFLAAGSRYVVATLRSVDDVAAARVTTAFHGLPAAMTPVERLAAAQRSLVGELPAGAWASFAVWGGESCDAAPSASSVAHRK